MDFGFIDSPHLLACVNYSSSSTRLKYHEELNPCSFNQSYETPVRKNKAKVKNGNFLSFNFGTNKSQNEPKKETGNDENSLNDDVIWKTKTRSPLSHGNSMFSNPEKEFSPLMSSSPNLETSRKIKTSQDFGSNIGEPKRFVHNSHLHKLKNNNENSTFFDPENVCSTKYQSDFWDTDCDLSASDKIITSTNIRKNLKLGCDSEIYSKGSRFHLENSTKVSENICEVKCRSELVDSSQFDCDMSVSDKVITAFCMRETLEVGNFSPSLCTIEQQSDEQIIPIQNIIISERKRLSQIGVESFVKEESLLINDFSSLAFTEIADRTLYPLESISTEQTSLQLVCYRSTILQASRASTMVFSPDFDFIGERKDLVSLELSEGKEDLMFRCNYENHFQNERDAEFAITCSKKSTSFPSISNHRAKENEFTMCKKESNYEDTNFQYKTDKDQEDSSEFDSDDFVSASEFCSSSSVAFYDLEEFNDLTDSESSEKENCCKDMLRNYEIATTSDFKNKSILQDRSSNRGKSQTSSATKNYSNLFDLNEPVIIKYLNEQTQEIDEMLIYPIEYHEKLIGKTDKKSRKEGLEKLIERSNFYVGKPVGLILDVKDIRKKQKPMSEESACTPEMFKEENSEKSVLTVKESLIDSKDKNPLLGSASGENIHYEKQTDRSRKEDHTSENSHPFTVTCPIKLWQNETCTSKEVQTEIDYAISPCHLNICERRTVSHSNSAIYLKENTNVISNDQKVVLTSVRKYKSKKEYCSPSAIQTLDTVSSKLNSNGLQNKHKRRLHEGKKPLKSVLSSPGIENSSKPSTFITHSTKQFRILRKAQSTDNFVTYPKKAGLSESKGNLKDIQKYNSSSNKHFDQSQEKWLQKRILTHDSLDFPCSRAIQKYDSFPNKHLNNSQEKSFQKTDLLSRKRVNIDEIISSDFKTYFSSYAKRGGRLKSGQVISKSKSTYWLKKAGVVYDDESLKFAEESFAVVARKKVVLNIYDYIHFLIILSKREKICLVDLVQRLKTGPTDDKKRMDSMVSLNTNLSGDSNFKNHCRYLKQLEKTPSPAPERFPSSHLSSTP